METRVSYVAVGAFVLVLGAALLAATLWLASGGQGQRQFDAYQAIVGESVSGLNLDAPVKFLGVDVGRVRAIRLAPNDPQRVQLIFAIQRGTPIKQDTVATLKTHGLTGIAFVELSGGSPEAPPLRAAKGELPAIRTKPSLGARLENVLTDTSSNVNALIDAENRAAIKRILEETAAVAEAVAAQKAALAAGIADTARTAHETAQASRRLAPLLAQIETSTAAVGKAAAAAEHAGGEASRSVAAATSGFQHFTWETLPEIERLIGELASLSASLRRLTEQTERNPSSLLLGREPVPAGPGESP